MASNMCPECQCDIDKLLVCREDDSLIWDSDEEKWIVAKPENDTMPVIRCPECHYELGDDAFKEMGISKKIILEATNGNRNR